MNLADVRQFYAEEIRAVSNIQSKRLVAARADGYLLASRCRFLPLNGVGSDPKIEGYSYLRQSIGSSRDAFVAGQTPNINPTPIDTVNPVTTAHMGIEAGSAGTRSMMMLLIPTASKIPRIPPRKCANTHNESHSQT